MSALDSISQWCLGIAARRWPDEARADLVREWQAELDTLAAEPRGGWRRLHFAASLAASPPVTDEDGVPLDWRNNRTGLSPVILPSMALLIAGLLAVAVSSLAVRPIDWLLGLTGLSFVDPLYDRVDETLLAIPPALFCLVAGGWIGRRAPMSAAHAGRFARAGSAAYAPVPVAVALIVAVISGGADPLMLLSLAVAVLVWAPGTSMLGVAAVRRGLLGHRRQAAALVLIGTLTIVAVSVLAALVPAALAVDAGFPAGLRAAAGFLPGRVFDHAVVTHAMTDGALDTVQGVARLPMTLLPYTLLALAYGLGAARRRTVAAPAPAAGPGRSAMRPAVVAVGTGCLALAIGGWAYTVAVLTPAMHRVAQLPELPESNGELYLWVAELRWAAILLAALGLLAAAAHRRSPLRAVMVLGGLLLGVDAVLERADVTGPTGLQVALAAGTLAAGVGWLIAGSPVPRTAGDRQATRSRLAVAAVIAALCGPLLHVQGTPAVNHRYLPLGLSLTTAGVAVLFVVLATVAAIGVRERPMPRTATAILVTVPALVLAGFGVSFGNGADVGLATLGALLAGPLGVVVVAVMRRHRARRPGLTAAVWTGFTILGAPLTIVFAYLAAMPGRFVPEFLFGLAGTDYPFEGISAVPGALLLAVPVGAWVAASLSRQAVARGASQPGVRPPTVPDRPHRPGGFVPGLAD